MHIFLFGERYSDFCYFVPNFLQESDSCKFPNWKGDNFCDDENNNAGCEWDGGDCCGDDVKENYCTACECLDPAKQCTGTCGSPHWKGDNWCDDENNNCGCEWDGGDCCGDDVKTNYCKDCLCLDPNATSTTTTTTPAPCTGTCYNSSWKDDKWCDDGNNNCGCDWDGGACCGDNVNTFYCTKCECLGGGGSRSQPPRK